MSTQAKRQKTVALPAHGSIRVTAFWLATAGGGEALDLPIGLFKEGYQFDALLVDAHTPASNLQIYPNDTHADVLQKIIYNAGRANVAKAWVGGSLVHEL